jgi:anti-repressor protein
VDHDAKGRSIVATVLARVQQLTIVSESGLYSLILKSRKPEAKAFKKWVTSEVLPSIRTESTCPRSSSA